MSWQVCHTFLGLKTMETHTDIENISSSLFAATVMPLKGFPLLFPLPR